MSKMKLLTQILAACAMTTAISIRAETMIRIDTEQITGKVNPMIFGQNIEAADERGIFQSADLPKPSPDSVNTGKGHWDPVNAKPDTVALKVLKEVKTGMLRYPGGCLAHNYDWRMTVGPLELRPDWKFGLDEFLALCKAVGAKPLIIFPDYVLPKNDLPGLASDLVEYLNAPALPQYPQAMKRAANGHPAPYGVKYFEIGNETYHCNHKLLPSRSYTPEEYVDFARKTIAATKKIDPSIQLGVVGHQMNLDKKPDYWDSVIYRELVPIADFVVHHYYAPDLYDASPEKAEWRTLSTGTVLRWKLFNTRRQMREFGGRELPIKITEYNVASSQNQPPRWQDSFLAGLNVTQLLLEFRTPGSGVDAAAYWQLIGGFFGIVQRDGKGGAIYKAPWPFFKFLTEKTGNELLSVTVNDNPQVEITPGKFNQITARGNRFIPSPEIGKIESFHLFFNDLRRVKASGSGDRTLIRIKFDGESAVHYPNILQFPRPKQLPENCGFSVSTEFEARFIPDHDNAGNVALGFGLMDSRGYKATRRAIAVYGLDKSREWKKYKANLRLDSDCTEILGLIRYEKPHGVLKGTLEIRNLEFNANGAPMIPAIPLLSVEASRRTDGKLALVVINRSPDQSPEGTICLSGTRLVSGDAFVFNRKDVNLQKTFEPECSTVKPDENSFRWTFPPHSLTIFELKDSK